MATDSPFLVYLPMRGPMTIAPASAGHAAHQVHHGGTGEVDVPVTEAELLAQRGQPAAAPDPVAEQRVDDHRHEEPEDEERRPLPALGHGAGRDRAGGVHEHHLEEEQREHADVVGVAAQEEALHAEEPERVAEQADRELAD